MKLVEDGRNNNYPDWSKKEDVYLKNRILKEDIKIIAKKLNRTSKAIYRRGYVLGIRRGRRTRYKRFFIDFSKLDKNILAYIAGLIDGEGTVSIRSDLEPYVKISNTNKFLLKWLSKIFNRKMDARKRGNFWKDEYSVILLNKESLLSLLKNVYTFLIVKKPNAKILISFCKRYLKGIKNKNQDLKDLNELRKLNKKGGSCISEIGK